MAFNYFDNSSILGGHVRSGTSGINSVDSNRIHGTQLGGGALFTTVGSHTWEAPPGVTSVCVVCIGGGGGGMYFNASGTNYTFAMSGGGGGTLAYLNDYPVVPGQSYTVQVGAGGSAGPGNAYTTGSTAGGESYAFGLDICRAFGGNPGEYNVDVATAGWSISSAYGTFGRGPGGGTIRAPSPGTSGYGPCGGGGAGGYGTDDGVGTGGTGRDDLVASGDNGTGGSGAGGGACNTTTNIDLHDHVSGGGGGTGIYGEGASGIASTDGWGGGGSGGEGGGTAYHGAPGGPPVANEPSSQDGGKYGGGGGGQSHINSMGADAGDGGQGAVRIIWGPGRAFPSTKVSLADSQAGETEY
jgi:predicted ribosomally synthesized peptide with SipW-like signal peptide